MTLNELGLVVALVLALVLCHVDVLQECFVHFWLRKNTLFAFLSHLISSFRGV